MQYIYGELDLTSCNLTLREHGSAYGIYDDRVVCIHGRIKTENGINDLEEISLMYGKYGKDITEYIGGTYILLLYDQKTKELFVCHDRTTSPVTFYYMSDGDKLFFGSSLKPVIRQLPAPRSFVKGQLEEFMCNGYLYSGETLVEGIYKIKAFHALHVIKGSISQIPVTYHFERLDKGEALGHFKPVLDRAIVSCFEGEDEINAPLSSGYDSSYLVHIANEQGSVPVHAFSVGGKTGKSELPLVEENIRYFTNASLVSVLTDEASLRNLPDIVWRLEGNVFESGIFLQYELAKAVSKAGKKYLMCGECADQVLNENYLREDRIFPEKSEYYEFSEYPYIFSSYLILKKNGILFNSFGIETRYPYLDNDFVDVAQSLRYENGRDKRCHVANCRECLPEQVLKNVSKIGGSTECHSLFADKDEIHAFFRYIENTDFYQTYTDLIKKYSYAETQKQTGIKKVKTTIRDCVLDLFKINKSGRRANDYFIEEMKIREYMKVMYLVLFEKLFLSGEYDNRFEDAGIQDELIFS